MDKTKPYRYKAGDRVVLVYLRHRPQGVVTIDQPRSSLTVHVRDEDGTNRTPNVNNIMLHEEWVKQEEARQAQEEALAGDSRKAMLDTFRVALNSWLQTHPIPPKGKQKKVAVQAAYDHALAAADARRYYDLGRGFAGRRLRASKDGRPQPVPTNDEQAGLSLIMIGGRALKDSYRKAARAAGVAPVVADADWDVVPAKDKPKLEIHVELPAETFAQDRVEQAYALVTSKKSDFDSYAFLPNFVTMNDLIGLTADEMETVIARLLENGYEIAYAGQGWLVFPPRSQPAIEERIKKASLPELRAWFGLLLDEISERTQEKQEAN